MQSMEGRLAHAKTSSENVLRLSISIFCVNHFNNSCHNPRCALQSPPTKSDERRSTIDAGMRCASVPADGPAIPGPAGADPRIRAIWRSCGVEPDERSDASSWQDANHWIRATFQLSKSLPILTSQIGASPFVASNRVTA